MKRVIITLALLGGFTALCTMESSAAVCVAGAHRAGCVSARGAVVVRHHRVGVARHHRVVVAPSARVIRR